jgi:hypothetical protein
MKIRKLAILTCMVAALGACNDEYEPETIPGNNLAGEWYVQTMDDQGNVLLGYQTILTATTAAADGSQIWVDDLGHIWPFKGKINANPEGNSFSGIADNIATTPIYDTLDVMRDPSVDPIDSLEFVAYHTMDVKTGMIFPDGGTSKTGVTTDSIYMEIEFSDDPGNTYVFAGHQRTGFVEDDY